MTNQHPITPPPELVQQWINEEDGLTAGHIATRAAQWGANQELEACVELTRDNDGYDAALGLRATRRPKPSSLKKQALEAMGRFNANAHTRAGEMAQDFDTIRRALEQLDD